MENRQTARTKQSYIVEKEVLSSYWTSCSKLTDKETDNETSKMSDSDIDDDGENWAWKSQLSLLVSSRATIPSINQIHKIED